MDKRNSKAMESGEKQLGKKGVSDESSKVKKGPLSFLTGALTSALLAFLSFRLSENVVIYFTLHSSNFNSAFAQSVASGFKTLVIGICFLATFSFAFIGLGLTIVFIRSLFGGNSLNDD